MYTIFFLSFLPNNSLINRIRKCKDKNNFWKIQKNKLIILIGVKLLINYKD